MNHIENKKISVYNPYQINQSQKELNQDIEKELESILSQYRSQRNMCHKNHKSETVHGELYDQQKTPDVRFNELLARYNSPGCINFIRNHLNSIIDENINDLVDTAFPTSSAKEKETSKEQKTSIQKFSRGDVALEFLEEFNRQHPMPQEDYLLFNTSSSSISYYFNSMRGWSQSFKSSSSSNIFHNYYNYIKYSVSQSFKTSSSLSEEASSQTDTISSQVSDGSYTSSSSSFEISSSTYKMTNKVLLAKFKKHTTKFTQTNIFKGNVSQGVFSKKNTVLAVHKVYDHKEKQIIKEALERIYMNVDKDIRYAIFAQVNNFAKYEDFSFFNEYIFLSYQEFEKTNLLKKFSLSNCYTAIVLDLDGNIQNENLVTYQLNNENDPYKKSNDHKDVWSNSHSCVIDGMLGRSFLFTSKIPVKRTEFNPKVLSCISKCITYMFDDETLKQEEINIKMAGAGIGGSIAISAYAHLQIILSNKLNVNELKKKYNTTIANAVQPDKIKQLENKIINYHLGAFHPFTSKLKLDGSLKQTNLPKPVGNGKVWLEIYIAKQIPNELYDLSHITVEDAKDMFVKFNVLDTIIEDMMNSRSPHAEHFKQFLGLTAVKINHIAKVQSKQDIAKAKTSQLKLLLEINNKINQVVQKNKRDIETKKTHIILNTPEFQELLSSLKKSIENYTTNGENPPEKFADQADMVYQTYLITRDDQLRNVIKESIGILGKAGISFMKDQDQKKFNIAENIILDLEVDIPFELSPGLKQSILADFSLYVRSTPMISHMYRYPEIFDQQMQDTNGEIIQLDKKLFLNVSKNLSQNASKKLVSNNFKQDFERANTIYLKIGDEIKNVKKDIFTEKEIPKTELLVVKSNIIEHFVAKNIKREIVNDLICLVVTQTLPNLIVGSFTIMTNDKNTRVITPMQATYLYLITYDITGTPDQNQLIVTCQLNWSLHEHKVTIECGFLFNQDNLIKVQEAKIYNLTVHGDKEIVEFTGSVIQPELV